MKSLPIPVELLIHTVEHEYGAKTGDGWNGEAWESSREVSRVRVEPSQSLTLSQENEEIRLKARLFYDCVNSEPGAVAFEVGDGIAFDGEVYTVVAVERLYDGEALHHLEMGLV